MPYKRIISLVPSLTELLFDLSLKDEIAGRTRFCIHPKDHVKNIQIIGGTKNPNVEKMREIQPDLVIANKEENRREDVEAIRQFCEVIVTEIETVKDGLVWIKKLGQILNKVAQSNRLINQIREHIPDKPFPAQIPTAYFIWKDPWMSIGHDTYIHDVMKIYGLKNVFSSKTRYPETTFEELIKLNPQLILLSSEPFPFKQKHIHQLAKHLPKSNIQLIDGEWFSWYGSRMLLSFLKLNKWRKQLSV